MRLVVLILTIELLLPPATSWAEGKPAEPMPVPQTIESSVAQKAAACDGAAGMPATQTSANPDHGLLGHEARRDAALEAVVTGCRAAVEADPKEGRFQHRLGLALAVLKRPLEAAAAYRQSAALGFAGGYDELGGALYTGSLAPGVEKDPDEAVRVWTEGVAKTDDPEIKRDLGDVLLTDKGGVGDPPRGRRMLEEAAAAHHLPAMADLASVLASGIGGGARDPKRARLLLDDAVGEGSGKAASVLGHLLYSGTGFERDETGARAAYQLGADGGQMSCMVALATMLADGEGGAIDVAGARKWFARASGLGDLDARRKLANSYLHADPKDPDKGLPLLIGVADAGSVQAMVDLAETLKSGDDVMRDRERAMAYFRKAADAGRDDAIERMGTMYDYGEGVAIDHPEARRLYDKAQAMGNADALTDIGMQYDHALGVPRDLREALVWYRRGAEKGASASLSNMGFAYETGRGVRQNLAAAKTWYEKAIDAGNRVAMHNLANMYLDGRGVAKNKTLGVELMRRSATRGLPIALNDLALMVHDDPHGDDALAVQLLRRATASQDLVEADLNLGMALQEGWDGRPEYVEANYWFARAAKVDADLNPQARAAALYRIGENLYRGRGIDADRDKGLGFIREAAAAKNANALRFLAALRSAAAPRVPLRRRQR